jgi:hypothetical protein
MAEPDPKPRPAERKPYERPVVKQVPLRPEEAVLGSCKITSGFGPTGTCGTTCSDAGS